MEGGASLETPVTDSGEVTTTTAPLALGDGQCGSVHRKNRLQGQITSGEDLANRKPWPTCVLYVLVAELCERFAFYGITGSLSLLLLNLKLPSVLAAELNALFGAVVYITPVIGAYAADVHLGRYRAILYFSAVYLLGMLTVTIGAWPTDSPLPTLGRGVSLSLVLGGLFVGVGVGAGGIKSNVVVLGADQFELPQQQQQQTTFFSFFYWAINIGATGAFLVLTNIALHGIPGIVSQELGFFVSFLLPTVAFAGAIGCFVAGRKSYRLLPPQGSAVLAFATTMRRACVRGRGRLLLGAVVLLPVAFISTVCSFFLKQGSAAQRRFARGGLGCIGVSLVLLVAGGSRRSWLRGADGYCGNGREADAEAVVRLLPLASTIVLFWLIYAQMSSNFLLQGCQMNLYTMGAKLSPATLNVLDSLVIMLLVPLIDRVVAPLLRRFGRPLGTLSKIGLGFGCSACAVLAAGCVERVRKAAPLLSAEDNVSSCPGGNQMSDLSIWWQAPQYLLIGLGEVFASITAYELFYAEARSPVHGTVFPIVDYHAGLVYNFILFLSNVPPHMRSVCQSINLLCTAAGSLAAAGVNSSVASLITDDLNEGRLELVFFSLSALMAANILLYYYLARQFKSERSSEHDGLQLLQM